MFRKAQGLPLSTIVIAALVVLVLVVIVAYFTGMFSRIGGGLSSYAPEEIKIARDNCKKRCLEIQQGISSGYYTNYIEVQEAYTSYTQTVTVGGVKKVLHCWEDPIKVPCNFEMNIPGTEEKIVCQQYGNSWTCTQRSI